MSAMPPQFFTNPHDMPQEFRTSREEELHDEDAAELGGRELTEEEAAELEGHTHGPGCGHEAIQHGDHVDYVHEGRRHFLHLGRWHRHA